MKVDLNLGLDGPVNPSSEAVAAERRGFAAGWIAETRHDAMIGLALAAEHTERIDLGTGIAVAFARSPMVTAIAANDVQLLAGGRLLLGLGSQVRPHITRRFSMPWSAPAARMREYVLALRAIWTSWNDRTPLNFRGEFYTHTLMSEFFDPGPNPYGPPRVFVAAVGERMTEVAGEVADGLLCHPFTTERYLREVTLPALARGRDATGRPSGAVEVSIAPFVVTGLDDEQAARADLRTRQRIAFYGSTPSYRGVLELHGWGDLHTELWTLSKRARWDEMTGLITDEVLAAFAVVAPPEQVAGQLRTRFGDLADRICLSGPDEGGALDPAIDALLAD